MRRFILPSKTFWPQCYLVKPGRSGLAAAAHEAAVTKKQYERLQRVHSAESLREYCGMLPIDALDHISRRISNGSLNKSSEFWLSRSGHFKDFFDCCNFQCIWEAHIGDNRETEYPQAGMNSNDDFWNS